ncbi:hypothetical protein [Gemmiger formicilis]|uniref:hypothetical protein n=1 Tax=Gemmiger formicilis TaxID=745368 RepID=UPI0031F61988
MNAMAYAPGEGVIDLYGGRKDLDAGIIRCVGEPSAQHRPESDHTVPEHVRLPVLRANHPVPRRFAPH